MLGTVLWGWEFRAEQDGALALGVHGGDGASLGGDQSQVQYHCVTFLWLLQNHLRLRGSDSRGFLSQVSGDRKSKSRVCIQMFLGCVLPCCFPTVVAPGSLGLHLCNPSSLTPHGLPLFLVRILTSDSGTPHLNVFNLGKDSSTEQGQKNVF